jgi:hypothetical protein
MDNFENQFENIRGQYLKNYQAFEIMSVLLQQLCTNKPDSENIESNFQHQEAILLINLTANNYPDNLAFVEDVKQKYNSLPTNIQNNSTFCEEFFLKLRNILIDIENEMSENLTSLTNLYRQRTQNITS